MITFSVLFERKYNEDLMEEVWIVAIVAKCCLIPKPAKRPQMAHILKALENPFRVVREEAFSSGRLRNNSSRRSWSAALFGSRRQIFSGSTNNLMNKEGVNGTMKAELKVDVSSSLEIPLVCKKGSGLQTVKFTPDVNISEIEGCTIRLRRNTILLEHGSLCHFLCNWKDIMLLNARLIAFMYRLLTVGFYASVSKKRPLRWPIWV
nr:probable LRR receptor-like serine/threonine-protein kinase At2g16250 [Tanacetum cinerariifolium]